MRLGPDYEREGFCHDSSDHYDRRRFAERHPTIGQADPAVLSSAESYQSMKKFVMWVAVLLPAQALKAEESASDNALMDVLQRAEAAYQRMSSEIRDYTCILTKRERIDGRLHGPESIYLKVRHQHSGGLEGEQPFSVYLRFLRPATVRDREVLYVQGRHQNRMIVRNGGTVLPFITTSVPLDSAAALQESRYPITEIGVKTLTRRLLEVGREKLGDENCEVHVVPGARLNGRYCTMIQVSHRERRADQDFHYVRVFIDDQLELPVYYVAYDWPRTGESASVLLEEYSYTDIQLNVGLTDQDFDHRNQNYLFLKSFIP